MMNYSWRSATEADLELLNQIHRSNMKGYVEQVYPWNPTLFIDNFVAEQYQVIETNNCIAGFIKVTINRDDVYLAEIQIAHCHQNQGIGSNILQNLIQQTKVKKQRLWLRVIKSNPVVKLYQRLGFTIFETNSTHLKLEIKR